MAFLIAWAIIGIIFFIGALLDNREEILTLPNWFIPIAVWAVSLIYVLAWPWPVWYDYQVSKLQLQPTEQLDEV